ncbi:MAG TPA: 2-thiouracil desulfurase family protein, partial [Candidatus Desulfaltia sp.]|nr:2-thiouracil desulfurase family protein [Candidatus Desulfaltia sp.]
INLQKRGDRLRVIQADTGIDLTEELVSHIDETLSGFGDVDAFILKASSPNCGLGSTKLWDLEGENVVGQGSGVFACEAQRRFPGSVFLDEEELQRIGVEGFLRLLEA